MLFCNFRLFRSKYFTAVVSVYIGGIYPVLYVVCHSGRRRSSQLYRRYKIMLIWCSFYFIYFWLCIRFSRSNNNCDVLWNKNVSSVAIQYWSSSETFHGNLVKLFQTTNSAAHHVLFIWGKLPLQSVCWYNTLTYSTSVTAPRDTCLF